jgi:FG-GAP-like repeat
MRSPSRTARIRCLVLGVTFMLMAGLGSGIAWSLGVYPGPALQPSLGAPRGLAAGDLDGDGTLDLVATASRSGRILFHPGRGDGTFSPARTLFVGGSPVAVSTADFDRDGLDDAIFVDEQDGFVGVLLQRPTFPVSFVVEMLRGADEPTSLFVVDLDGDQWPDVAVAQRGADQISIFPNLQGSLGSPRVLPAGDGPFRLGTLPSIGPTVLFVLHSGFLSNDLMSLDLSSEEVLGRIALTGPTDLLVYDHDDDSASDLVILDGGAGTVKVFGTADAANFLPVDSWDVESGSQVIRVLTSAPGQPRYLVGDSARASFSVYERVGAGFEKRRSWLGGENIRDLVLADFDADGSEELAVSLTALDAVQISSPLGSGFKAFETVFTGRIPQRIRPRPTGQTSYSILCTGAKQVWSYDLAGNELSFRDLADVHTDAIRHAWADFDGDGREDLVILVARLGLQLHRNNGLGFDVPLTLPLDGELRDLEIVDAIGDANLDLVVANATLSSLVIFEGDGVSGFAPADTMFFAQRPARVRSEDLDLDGRKDLVVLSVESHVSLSYRRDSGLANPIVFAVGEEPRDAAFGDFNGDPYPDVVIANAGGGTFTILNSVVQGIYSPTTVGQSTPSGAQNVVVTDIDLSGQDDIVFSSPSSQHATYHLNTGTLANPTGRFTLPQRIRVGVLPLDFVVADIDGDPVGDFLVLDASSSTVVLVRSDPLSLATPAAVDLEAEREGESVRLHVLGTAVTSAEFQLRRESDARRLVARAVAPREWLAEDLIPADASENYLLYDRVGRLLDRVEVNSVAAEESSEATWRILPPRTLDGVTEFRFRSPSNDVPQVEIIDLRGRRVTRLRAEPDGARWHRVRWRGNDERGVSVARGRYWARLEAGGESRSVALRAPR